MVQRVQYADQHVLSYAEYGDTNGYPVLFHHGLIGGITQPDLNQILAGQGIRMILVARPGYGESSTYAMASYADWITISQVLIDHLDLRTFDVVGVSAGAPYAYALAALMPQHVQRVFISSGLPALYLDGIYETYPDPPAVTQFYDFCRTAPLEEIAQQLHDMYIAPLPEDVKASSDVQAILAQHCMGMAQEARLQSVDWGFEVTDISQLVVIQHSITDAVVPFRAVQRTARLLKDYLLYTLDDAPHSSPETYALFLQRLLQHINTTK